MGGGREERGKQKPPLSFGTVFGFASILTGVEVKVRVQIAMGIPFYTTRSDSCSKASMWN